MKLSIKLLGAALGGALLVSCQNLGSPVSSGPQTTSVDADISDHRNVIVLTETEQSANTLLINAARRGYQLNDRQDLNSLNLIMLEFIRPTGVSGAIAISDMRKMDPSVTAGLDHFYSIEGAQSPIQAAGPRLYAQDMLAWPESGCPAHTAIGMIDGEINLSHPGFQSANIVHRDFSGGNAGAVEHGTAIADLLIGPGQLHGAQLYSASVVTSTISGRTGAGLSELISAIDWMQSSNVSLVNISLAGPYNFLLDRVVQVATDDGMIIIAAVGNDGPDAEPRYPAAFDSVIAVTAIDAAREIYENAVHGDHVDFAAPGVDVFIGDRSNGQYLSGTSVAAPFVTAVIASDIALAHSDDIQDLRRQIGNNSEDLGAAGKDRVFGTGLIRTGQSCASMTETK